MAKNTPSQHFRDLFNRYIAGSTENERAEGEKKMDAWLKRHGKTRINAPKVLLQAARDDEAAKPPPPPSDPRDAAPNPFEDPRFNAASPAPLAKQSRTRTFDPQNGRLGVVGSDPVPAVL